MTTAAEQAVEQLPFRVTYDPDCGQLVLTLTVGVQPRQRVTSQLIPSQEHVAYQIALHRHEARLRGLLADAAARHLGADPQRLEAAVESLSDPTSALPVSSILCGEEAPPHRLRPVTG